MSSHHRKHLERYGSRDIVFKDNISAISEKMYKDESRRLLFLKIKIMWKLSNFTHYFEIRNLNLRIINFFQPAQKTKPIERNRQNLAVQSIQSRSVIRQKISK